MIVRVLLVLAVLAATLWLIQWVRSRPSEETRSFLRKSLLWGVVALLVIAALTGRLNPMFAAIGAAVPLAIRFANLLRVIPVLQQLLRSLGLGDALGGAAGARGGPSVIRSRYLEVRLDQATGSLDGIVVDGPFKGRMLSTLGLDELLRMHELYRESDAQSLALLEAYLDRTQSRAWRSRAHSGRGGRASKRGTELGDAEARAILGVDDAADAEAIRAAHRRLMQRLHPDRGGSDYLAAKINEAKRRLLGE